MAKQLIFIGASANDKTGDPIRTAFDKVNQNFTELYSGVLGGGASVTESVTAPNSPAVGNLWYDTVGGRMYIYYDSTWVDTNPLAESTPGNKLVNGDFNFTLGPDGTVNFDPSSANGKGILQTAADLQLIAVDKVWTFGTDGDLTIPNNGTIADSNSYLTTLNLYVQGSLKGVDGSTGTTGQILTRQSNGGVAWANLAALPYVKSTFTGGTATLDIFTATWVNSVAIRLQISVSNTVNVTLQYTATSIIAGTTTSTNGGGMWTQPPSGDPFSSNNLDNLGDIQVMYLQDITNQKIYRITGMNTAGNVNPAQGSVLIEQII